MDSSTADSPRQAEASPFRLRLLGSPFLEAANGGAVPGLGPGKSLAMLAYLSVRGPARRDELINVLWGEIPEEKARNAFRQSLHRLRAVLGEEILPQDREQVALRSRTLLEIDRDRFIDACRAARWDDAVANYGGEFLEGFESREAAFDRWADAERLRLRVQFQEAILAAGQEAVLAGRVHEALQYARRLAAAIPFDENAALFEANTLLAAGQPTQALSSLVAFSARLKDELDLAAPPAIRALQDRLQKRDARERRVTPTERGHPFVGRNAELARMVGALGELRSERGGTVFIAGDAGIGKSRLLDEFADRARDMGGVLLLRSREALHAASLPYASLVDALRPLAHAAGVSGASRHLLAEAARLLPELRDAFELPAVGPLEDETSRLRFFEGIAALLDAAAYEKPVCLIIEDAHYASPSTADLISYLSQRLRQSPVLIVMAFRPDRAAGHASERWRGLATRDAEGLISLEPLSPAETEELVRAAVGFASHVNAQDLRSIVEASGGRPMVALDLARRVVAGQPLPNHLITLREVLWARFQSLSPSQRRVFFAATFFARGVSLRLLAAAAHLSEAATFDAVAVLTRAGLLSPMVDGYALAHDSTQSFLVDASGVAGRALLAGWAAEALAAEPHHDEAELASLFAMAGRTETAFTYARLAAFKAAAVGGLAEAMRLLGMALTFAPSDEARREIDSLLVGLGGGERLSLPGSGVEETTRVEENLDAEASTDVPLATASTEPVASEPPRPADLAERPVRRRATVRQWVMSIGISLAMIAAGLYARRALSGRAVMQASADTLYLSERTGRGPNTLHFSAAPLQAPTPLIGDAASDPDGVQWTDSLSSPWSSALVSPDGQRVAIQRATPRGEELFVVSANRRDTLPVSRSAGDNTALGWSPDSRTLLVARSRMLGDGSLDKDLYAISAITPTSVVALDTSSNRLITEAKWSPTGVAVAWVARVGATRQQDIFVSRADGTDVHAVAANPADDYDIAWSPDGSLLAFTSTRGGGTRLYVYDFENARLWPISDQRAESHAVFSPDSRAIAFESTRDGDLAVYVRPALGGTARRITPPGRQFTVASWRGKRPVYVDRLRVLGSGAPSIGDTSRLSLLAAGPDGAVLPPVAARWTVVDPGVVQLEVEASDSSVALVAARAIGNARVVASIPGWRSDTMQITVSGNESVHLHDDFTSSALNAQWLPLGSPRPVLGTAPGTQTRAVFPNGDLEWESGLLLRAPVQLRPGLRLRARVFAPFVGRPSPAVLTVGLVSAVAERAIDPAAPRPNTLVGVQWNSASGSFVYSVGQESSAELAAAINPNVSHEVEIAVHADRSIVFSVDGQKRWTSSLTFLGQVAGAPVQLWIGGRATGLSVAVTGVRLDLAARSER